MTAALRRKHRDGAKQPIGRLHSGDLRLKCARCDRPLLPFDITLAEHDTVVIDCICGERSEIWLAPQICA
jgi:hypothetical protein